MRSSALIIATLGTASLVIWSMRAHADTSAPAAAGPSCLASPVTARGEPASLQWLALLKARGNWRARVRMTENMGADYADWNVAADQVERCVENTGSIVCTVSGIPCRP